MVHELIRIDSCGRVLILYTLNYHDKVWWNILTLVLNKQQGSNKCFLNYHQEAFETAQHSKHEHDLKK